MRIRKSTKWLAAIVLAPISLFIFLLVLLYLPPVQNWIVKKVADYASQKTGLEISVGHVSLSFPLDLKLEQVMALRPNDSIPQRRDTVADVKELVADVQLIPLLKKTSRDRPTHLQRTESEHYELYWRLADKGQFGTVASGFAWHRP